MARVKPTERKLVSTLLMQEAEDAEELAERIIKALDEKRQADEIWMINFWEPNVRVLMNYGPYATQNAAKKDIAKLAAAGPTPAQAQVVKLKGIRE